MKKLIYSHSSAFLIYRSLRNQKRITKLTSIKRLNFNQAEKSGYRYSHWDTFECLGNNKADILVHAKSKMHASKKFKFHCCMSRIPNGSYLKLSEDEYIASPELMFCQLANVLTFPKLMLIGLEICGSYSIERKEEKGFIDCLAGLTAKDKLIRYIKSYQKMNPNFRGHKLALRAANAISDNSASPQESRLYVMLCAPRDIGGYGVKNAILNYKVPMSQRAKVISGQNQIIVDIACKETKLVIEYDSDRFHNNNMQNSKDKRRADALMADG